jgi:hypothetical protein
VLPTGSHCLKQDGTITAFTAFDLHILVQQAVAIKLDEVVDSFTLGFKPKPAVFLFAGANPQIRNVFHV